MARQTERMREGGDGTVRPSARPPVRPSGLTLCARHSRPARQSCRAPGSASYPAKGRPRRRRVPQSGRPASAARNSAGGRGGALAPRRLLSDLSDLRARLPAVPVVAYAPFRPDDGELLLACRKHSVASVAVEGVDDPIVGDLVLRASITAERRRALAEAPRMLRLTEPLQQAAWNLLLGEVERPMRTTVLASRLQISREHLSRQFGAGGAPNLKRVIDLTRIACAAQLLDNPGYAVRTVVRVLHFTSSNHLANTARRIANVPTSGLARLGSARGRSGEYEERAAFVERGEYEEQAHPNPIGSVSILGFIWGGTVLPASGL